MTQLCRGTREGYFLQFKKISKTYPPTINGTYTFGEYVLRILAGKYYLYTPATPPYTCYEEGNIVDNKNGTVTITPTKLYGCESDVDGYYDTLTALTAAITCDSTTSGQTYQVGEWPNSKWYQCICGNSLCQWTNITNPVCEEIDSLLDLPDSCSGDKIYYGNFGSGGSTVYYGCVSGEWRDVINPNDPFSQEGKACVGLSYTIPFYFNQGYSTPKNGITRFMFEQSRNPNLLYDIYGGIDRLNYTIDAIIPYGISKTALTPAIKITGAKVDPNNFETIDFTNEVIYECYSSDNTIQEYEVNVVNDDGTSCDITEFWFNEELNSSYMSSDYYGVIDGTTINVYLPYGTTISSLKASFVINGASVNISSVVQESGVTSNNFSTDLTYTCVSSLGYTQNYTIKTFVSNDADARSITSFILRSKDNDILSEDYTGVIDEVNGTISVTLPERLNFISLYPTISITGVSVVPKSRTSADFSGDDEVTFTVTSYSTLTKDYVVTIIASDDPSQELEVSFYNDEDTTSEIDLTPSGWVSDVNFSIGIPDSIKDILRSVSAYAETFKDILTVGRSTLNIAKLLLQGLQNPVLTAFDFFLDYLIQLVQNIKNSGIYYCLILPDQNLYKDVFIEQDELNPHYLDYETEGLLRNLTDDERAVYEDLVLVSRNMGYFGFKKISKLFKTSEEDPTNDESTTVDADAEQQKEIQTCAEIFLRSGLDVDGIKRVETVFNKFAQKTGLWLMSGKLALEIYADSFTNRQDKNQPLYKQSIPILNYSVLQPDGVTLYKSGRSLYNPKTTYAGGMILWLGLEGGENIYKAFALFKAIIQQFSYFLKDNELDKLSIELGDVINKLQGEWQPEATYYVGDVVTPTTSGGSIGDKIREKYKYTCTKVSSSGFGTSSSTEPSWGNVEDDIVEDNDITWQETISTEDPIAVNGKYWRKKRIFRDLWKDAGDVLDLVEGTLVGYKDKIPTGFEVIDKLTDYLTKKIEELDTLITLIDNFLTVLDNLEDLTQFNMKGYMVPVQTGGIQKLIEAATISGDSNKPSKNDYTLGLFSFVGTGVAIPGYLLLIQLLFSNSYPEEFESAVKQASFPWGLDNLASGVFSDQEEVRERFLDSNGNIINKIQAEVDNINLNNPF